MFLDQSDIAPGEDWETAIDTGITNASVLVLLHCCHSIRSRNVEKEIGVATASKTAIVPILLCSAPMVETLRRLQWIDLRSAVRHDCEHNSALAVSTTTISSSEVGRQEELDVDDVSVRRAGVVAAIGAAGHFFGDELGFPASVKFVFFTLMLMGAARIMMMYQTAPPPDSRLSLLLDVRAALLGLSEHDEVHRRM